MQIEFNDLALLSACNLIGTPFFATSKMLGSQNADIALLLMAFTRLKALQKQGIDIDSLMKQIQQKVDSTVVRISNE